MEEEDDDQRLLHSLGVTSANIEDIERKVLSEAKTDPKRDTESGPSINDPESREVPEADPQAELHQKLRSVQLEINAVASTIKGAKHTVGKKSDRSDSADAEDKKKKHFDGTGQDTPHGGALQQALAAERLRSLKKAKAQIQKEILQSDPSLSGSDNQPDKMLAMLVEEEPRRKKPLKQPGRPKESSTRWLKTVTYNDDNDFDAVLDGAFAGFMETEREELIRKGLLTPFHKLKGFEKRVEQPGPSHVQNNYAEQDEETMEASSIAKVAQSTFVP